MYFASQTEFRAVQRTHGGYLLMQAPTGRFQPGTAENIFVIVSASYGQQQM
jgi:hypothetical protein